MFQAQFGQDSDSFSPVSPPRAGKELQEFQSLLCVYHLALSTRVSLTGIGFQTLSPLQALRVSSRCFLRFPDAAEGSLMSGCFPFGSHLSGSFGNLLGTTLQPSVSYSYTCLAYMFLFRVEELAKLQVLLSSECSVLVGEPVGYPSFWSYCQYGQGILPTMFWGLPLPKHVVY